jgi:glycogen debranching enzyme
VSTQLLDPAAAAIDPLQNASAGEPHRQFALKHEDCFIVSDAFGDIRGIGDGFFCDDTRLLSDFRMFVGGKMPSLLGASLSQDNILFTAHLSNSPLQLAHGEIRRGVIHLERTRFLRHNRMFERLTATNYSGREVILPLRFTYKVDFRDMFEVRGKTRARRGVVHEPRPEENRVVFRYEGLDRVVRQSVIGFSRRPDRITGEFAEFSLSLPRRGQEVLFLEVGGRQSSPANERFRASAVRAHREMRSKRRQGATIYTSGRVFNDWLTRARADIVLLTTELDTGPYPYAGIPWFSTAFGRDGVISALQMLWINPALARGVLRYLSRHQSTETASFSDAEPGKIMHETRKGEMAVMRELPFGRYYGGVDTTPLYAFLAARYADRTADTALIDEIWQSLCAAADWMERRSRSDPYGFVTYERAEDTGLRNQGWKDSADAVFHADGRVPPGPIALVEVQGYVFAAYRGLAGLAERRGEHERAARWRKLAEEMRASVEKRFWMREANYYALAIDGNGEPCAVRTSNAGHLLFVGLPSPKRAAKVADTLLSANFHSGWGLRTLADDEIPFNPMSYHNGSIWPHDTAICAAGMARYGDRENIAKLMSETFEAAVHFNMRLPELFCGFTRQLGEAPVAYPVACLPQAWSAGAVYMLIQACLGLKINAWKGEVEVMNPRLPIGIDNLFVRHIGVGDREVDIAFERVGDHVVCFLDNKDKGSTQLIVRS